MLNCHISSLVSSSTFCKLILPSLAKLIRDWIVSGEMSNFKTPMGEFVLVAFFLASKIFFPNLSPRFIRTRLLEVYPFSTWDVLDGIRMKSWDPTSWAHGKSFLAIFARLNLHAHFLLTHCLWIFFISLVFLALIGMDARLLCTFLSLVTFVMMELLQQRNVHGRKSL